MTTSQQIAASSTGLALGALRGQGWRTPCAAFGSARQIERNKNSLKEFRRKKSRQTTTEDKTPYKYEGKKNSSKEIKKERRTDKSPNQHANKRA
jgi:hypothetical protein